MRLPLLLGANTNLLNRGPSVPVTSGKWRVIMDGVKSHIHIYYGSPLQGIRAMDQVVIELEDDGVVFAKVNESHDNGRVSLYIERVEE